MKASSNYEEPVSPAMTSNGIFGLQRPRKGVDICLALIPIQKFEHFGGLK
jgi:hypothetical protein